MSNYKELYFWLHNSLLQYANIFTTVIEKKWQEEGRWRQDRKQGDAGRWDRDKEHVEGFQVVPWWNFSIKDV